MTEQTRTCATCTENDGDLCDLKGIIVEDDDIQMIEDFIFEQVYIPKNDFTISNMDQSTSIFINGLKLSYIKKIPQ